MKNDCAQGAMVWLNKAGSDLGSAKILSERDDPFLDTAIYHCQQCAEKAVKAFLHFHSVGIQKTHNVSELVEASARVEARFDTLLADADLISPLAVAFRYPDESDWHAPLEPSLDEFNEALTAAQRIYDFVISVLPPETHPV